MRHRGTAARIPAARRPSLPAVDFIRCHQKPAVLKAGGDAGNGFAACRQMLPLYGKRPEYKETRLFFFFRSANQTFYLSKELKEPAEQAETAMLGPNHGSALDCTSWDSSSNVCRSDCRILSSCLGLDSLREHRWVPAFLSFHAKSSAQLRQGAVIFPLNPTHAKSTQKPGIREDYGRHQGSCRHTAYLHTSSTLIPGWDRRQSRVRSRDTWLQVKLTGRGDPTRATRSDTFLLQGHPWERSCWPDLRHIYPWADVPVVMRASSMAGMAR